MATTVLFDLIDTLFAQCTAALTTVQVYDGVGISEDPGDFLMIGVDDPDTEAASPSAESRQSWAGLGKNSRDEVGAVTCAALSWNGDGDLAAARNGAQAITTAVENLLRNDPSLGGGVAGLMWTGYGEQTRLIQLQDSNGALALVIFDIAFVARI